MHRSDVRWGHFKVALRGIHVNEKPRGSGMFPLLPLHAALATTGAASTRADKDVLRLRRFEAAGSFVLNTVHAALFLAKSFQIFHFVAGQALDLVHYDALSGRDGVLAL